MAPRFAPQTLALVLIALALLLHGCADPNLAPQDAELCARGLANFWWGLWHGLVAPFAFLGSLFDADIAIYDVCNNGGWYDFGFCLGIGAFTGSSHAGSTRRRRRRRDDE